MPWFIPVKSDRGISFRDKSTLPSFLVFVVVVVVFVCFAGEGATFRLGLTRFVDKNMLL